MNEYRLNATEEEVMKTVPFFKKVMHELDDIPVNTMARIVGLSNCLASYAGFAFAEMLADSPQADNCAAILGVMLLNELSENISIAYQNGKETKYFYDQGLNN